MPVPKLPPKIATAATKPERMAYKVYKNERYVGDLGEGRGPFISVFDSALGYVWLDHTRYTSRSAKQENAVAQVLKDEPHFNDVVRALERSGFTLEPAEYLDLFLEPDDAATHTANVEGDQRATGEQ